MKTEALREDESRITSLCASLARRSEKSQRKLSCQAVVRFNEGWSLEKVSAIFRTFMSSPEELAREKIDPLLEAGGWLLQNRSTINLSASRGIALREALLKDRDEVDYLLF